MTVGTAVGDTEECVREADGDEDGGGETTWARKVGPKVGELDGKYVGLREMVGIGVGAGAKMALYVIPAQHYIHKYYSMSPYVMSTMMT